MDQSLLCCFFLNSCIGNGSTIWDYINRQHELVSFFFLQFFLFAVFSFAALSVSPPFPWSVSQFILWRSFVGHCTASFLILLSVWNLNLHEVESNGVFLKQVLNRPFCWGAGRCNAFTHLVLVCKCANGFAARRICLARWCCGTNLVKYCSSLCAFARSCILSALLCFLLSFSTQFSLLSLLSRLSLSLSLSRSFSLLLPVCLLIYAFNSQDCKALSHASNAKFSYLHLQDLLFFQDVHIIISLYDF